MGERGEVKECDRGRMGERRGHGKQVVSKTIEAHTARSAFIYSVWAVSHASLTALWPFYPRPPAFPFFTHCMPEWSRKTCHHHHQREINLNGHEAVCWALLPLRFFCLLFLHIFPFLPLVLLLLLLLLLGFCGCFTRLNRPELSAGNCNCDWLGAWRWNWSPGLLWSGLLALSCSPDRVSCWLFAHSSADYEVEQTAKCVNLWFGRSILIAVVAPQLPRPVYPVRRHWDWLWAGAAVLAEAEGDAFKWAILCGSFKLFFLYLVLIVAAFAG